MSSAEKIPARHIPLSGTPNFRDYGGYQTVDGHKVKWRQLFRSGELSALTQEDVSVFKSLNIELVFDFRRDEEKTRQPSIFPEGSLPDVVGLPITPGDTSDYFERVISGDADRYDLEEMMCAINREFVFDQSQPFRNMFERLLNHASGVSLLHCAAGKDRTGFAVAMVLSALGVSQRTILTDYMLTEQFVHPEKELKKYQGRFQWGANLDVMRPIFEVNERYLLSSFTAIMEEFGSVDTYLQDMLGVGKEEKQYLRDKYLD